MLKTRAITALLLAAGLLATLFLLPAVWAAAIFAGIAALAAWEWGELLQTGDIERRMFAAVTFLLCAALYVAGMPRPLLLALWLPALLFWLLLVPLWLTRKWQLNANAIGFLIGWLLLIPCWAGMVMLHSRSPLFLLATMMLVWIADIAAYFAGCTFGKHKLAPAISPGKTWEGAAGAVAAVIVYGVILGWGNNKLALLTPVQIVLAMAGLILLTVVSIIGDLFESLVKRQAGVKDSSQLLPGHGGVLDRIDSLLSTLPIIGLLSLFLF